MATIQIRDKKKYAKAIGLLFEMGGTFRTQPTHWPLSHCEVPSAPPQSGGPPAARKQSKLRWQLKVPASSGFGH